jgi:hypothetical protein
MNSFRLEFSFPFILLKILVHLILNHLTTLKKIWIHTLNSKTRPCNFLNLECKYKPFRGQGFLPCTIVYIREFNLVEKQNFIIMSNSKSYWCGVQQIHNLNGPRVDKTHAQKTLATYFKLPLDQKESRSPLWIKRNLVGEEITRVILSNIIALHVTTSHMHPSFQESRLWHGTSQDKMRQNTELHSIQQEQLTRNSVMRLCSWKPGPNIWSSSPA